ncbi:hypothetical protein EHS25_005713 [Saitozyma podzolica]|uniref:Uncharacterized protein n=1 Tax=Saitozyma podzolica TaxID=1890683 RepID=A0A427XW00_9TREE|nr:hypothetical protein EHS25_005713 [Saitozyma podzolica]
MHRDLASTLGPNRPILAHLVDIYIVSPDDSALEQTPAFFDERQLSISLNPAECKKLALKDIRTNGPRMLGTCVGAYSAESGSSRRRLIMRQPPSPSSSTSPPSMLPSDGLCATELASPTALSQVE